MVVSRDVSHDRVVDDVMESLVAFSIRRPPWRPSEPPDVTEPLSVHVALDGGRDYDILIGRGLVAQAGARLAALGARAAGIVTDSNVGALYAADLKASLEAAGLRAGIVTVPPGEASKSYGRFAEVCDGLLALKIERNDLVVALGGGGVVGDLAGFAAASLPAGVRFVQVPTSLLAQVDSSVGGKTGINSPSARTSSAPSTSRASCWPTRRASTRCRSARCARAMPRSRNTG